MQNVAEQLVVNGLQEHKFNFTFEDLYLECQYSLCPFSPINEGRKCHDATKIVL